LLTEGDQKKKATIPERYNPESMALNWIMHLNLD
jgi:hypothetical protein